jgi:hypothetical protein
VKTYLAMYRCVDGRQAAERITDTSLHDALGRAKWRAMAVAIAHKVDWTDVELIGIEELVEDPKRSGLERAAGLAARLADSRQEAYRLVDAALEMAGHQVRQAERPELRTA